MPAGSDDSTPEPTVAIADRSSPIADLLPLGGAREVPREVPRCAREAWIGHIRGDDAHEGQKRVVPPARIEPAHTAQEPSTFAPPDATADAGSRVCVILASVAPPVPRGEVVVHPVPRAAPLSVRAADRLEPSTVRGVAQDRPRWPWSGGPLVPDAGPDALRLGSLPGGRTRSQRRAFGSIALIVWRVTPTCRASSG